MCVLDDWLRPVFTPLAIMNGYVMAGEAGPALYEVEQVEDGWKVRCRVTRADGAEL